MTREQNDHIYAADNDDENDVSQGKNVSQEVLLDQATDKKSVSKANTPEMLGVSWTEGSYSGKNLRAMCLLVWLIMICFAALSGWLLISRHAGIWSVLPMIVPVVAWGYFVAVYLYRTQTLRYKLTQHQFYCEAGFLTKTIDTLELVNIDDMTVKQTLMDRWINGGTGSITILSDDKTHPKLVIRGLENPRAAFESIDEMRRRKRNARVIRSVN
ncbi:MAG: PH domain-containing protein [Planctomycetaceae bacterium]|nr:PH domain-containing protein [Planctomycetaceae bacterium]